MLKHLYEVKMLAVLEYLGHLLIFLLMSWELLSLLEVLGKDKFFLEMFQLKVLKTIYCFPIGCFELKTKFTLET